MDIARASWKLRVQSVLRDVRDVCHPAIVFSIRLWGFLGPRLTNRAMMAVIIGDLAMVMHIEASGAAIDLTTIVLAMAANLITPLTPQGAPHRLPETDYGRGWAAGGATGPGAELGVR